MIKLATDQLKSETSSVDSQALNSSAGVAAKLPVYDQILRDYVEAHSVAPSRVLADARSAAVGDEWEFMQTTPDQASFLYLLVKILGAKTALEIGCYFGHSSVAIASALPADGRLISLDHNPRWAASAKEIFRKAGLEEKIDLRIGEALDLLDQMAAGPIQPVFDFVFVDADKINSPNYYERAVDLLRPGGVIVVDNVLWRGQIVNPEDQSPRALALRRLNEMAAKDGRVEMMILTLSDGMLMARKREYGC